MTAWWDATAGLWDADTGGGLAVFRGHKSYVKFANFSPDGTRIVTISNDFTARLWDTTFESTNIIDVFSAWSLTPLSNKERRAYFLPDLPINGAMADSLIDQESARQHQSLAEGFARAQGNDQDLVQAFFHYAVAEKLFAMAGDEYGEIHNRYRRATLARQLFFADVEREWLRAQAWIVNSGQ